LSICPPAINARPSPKYQGLPPNGNNDPSPWKITPTNKNHELQNLETIEKKAQRVDRLADPSIGNRAHHV